VLLYARATRRKFFARQFTTASRSTMSGVTQVLNAMSRGLGKAGRPLTETQVGFALFSVLMLRRSSIY
jgi:hypothetical protein